MMQRDGTFGLNTWVFIVLALILGGIILWMIRGTVQSVISGVIG